MTEIWRVLSPRTDVREGTLSDAIFAASLDEVVAGTAPDAYGDAETFFAATHPSQGLKELLNESLGRVSGGRPDASPVIRLETNLGGGKTHNLIALWHAASGGLAPMRSMEFMDPANLPTDPVERTAVFVGTSAGAESFPAIGGVTTATLWEHLALQLGGPEAAAKVHTDDLTAPGARVLKEVLGEEPALILIDELARYLAVASGREVGGSNLARQTVTFLMALMEAVDARPQASLVLTTTEVTDAFGEQTQATLDAIREAGELTARREHVIRPSGEADLPSILTRRLFEALPPGAGTEIGDAYAEAAADAFNRGADLPITLQSAGWAGEIASSYPWHPDLLRVLDKRLSTIPNFQRTRGALRLLARTVRLLWEHEPEGVRLIHPHHLDLADRDTVEDLSSRLGHGTFEPVIRTDIAGEPGADPAHAEEVDARLGSSYARRLATTAYLYSLTAELPGISAPELMGAVFAPGDDHNVVARAMDALEESCWYLHVDDRGYRFSVEPSVVKLVQDAVNRVTLGTARQAATEILGDQFRDAALKVRRIWEDAAVPDREDEATLVVLHWDDFGDARGVNPDAGVPRRVQELWEKTPSGGLREFRNRVVFLVPSPDTHDAMNQAVRRHLALKALASDSSALHMLAEERRQEIRDEASSSEAMARIAVCNHVNLLYVPRPDGLEANELSTVTQASLKRNQTDAVVDRLAAMGKTLAAGDPPLDPAMIRDQLGASLDKPMTTADLVRAFARRRDLKMVLDRDQIRALVRNGVVNGQWEYEDTTRADDGWATVERPNADYRVEENTLLHPVGSAPERQETACPLCGKVHTGPCASSPSKPATDGFTGEGSGSAVLGATLDKATDAARTGVSRMTIAIDPLGAGTNRELARLLSVVPDGTATDLLYRVDFSAALDTPEHTARLQFVGTPSEYASVRSAAEQVLGSRDATLTASVEATWDPAIPLDGTEIADLRQRMTDTGPTKCRLTIETT